MRLPFLVSALAVVLGLSACSGRADRSAYLNTLIGQQETELLRQLGVPTRTFDTGGHRFLAYEEQHSSEIFGGGFGGGLGSFYGRGFAGFGFAGYPVEVVTYRCETTFEIENQRVTSWALRGNDCG